MLKHYLNKLKKNWRYLLIAPLFFIGLITAFLLHNGVPIFSPEALLTYLLFITISLIPGLMMGLGGTVLQISIATFIIVLLIISQTSNLHLFPVQLKYYLVFGLIIASIATALYFSKKHLDKLLLVIFTVFCIGAFFTPATPFIVKQNFALPDQPNKKLPPYIHIVLDEHIGIEGISPDKDKNLAFSNALKKAYLEKGFKLYGRAYSRYLNTASSFPSFLNFDATNHLSKYIITSDTKCTITQNALFEHLSQKGYQINVVQNSFLDLCSRKENFNLKSCLTYEQSLPIATNFSIKTKERTTFIINNLITKLHLSRVINKLIPELSGNGSKQSAAMDVNNLYSSTATYRVFNDVLNIVKKVEPGNAYFIHLLLPHRHYVFDESCNFVGFRGVTTQNYIEQAKCTHKLIDQLVEVIAANDATKNSTIIIHGDHGSRIQENSLEVKTQFKQFKKQDFLTTFSIFFAVRSPVLSAGYDRTQLPLDYLLQYILLEKQPSPTNKEAGLVYLEEEEPTKRKAYPMPAFAKGRALN